MKKNYSLKFISILMLTMLMFISSFGFKVSAEDEEINIDQSNEVLEETSSQEELPENIVDKEISFETEDFEIKINGKLPEDSRVEVKEIIQEEEYNNYIEEASKKLSEEDGVDTLAYARFFDITILHNEDEIFEPEESLKVSINLKDKALEVEDVTFTGIHFDEKEEEVNVELVPVEIEDQVAVLEAESFSVYGIAYYYTVDFFFNDNEYHMNGGSEILLSDLFMKLAIDKNVENVTNVEFSDNSLIEIIREENNYKLRSLKPFTSHELLTINFNDGEVILINVEDEIASGTFGASNSLKWSIDDEGHFILEPVDGRFGTIDKQYSSATTKGGTTPRESSTRPLWPWESYKDKIITAEIKGEIRSYGSNNDFQLIGMFEWCENMVSVDVSGLNTSRLGVVSYFFANCPSLKTITGLDKWTESVHQNTNVKEGTNNIINIASMFRGCTSLEEVDLSSWTSNGKMKNFQNLCNGCTSLKSFKLNNEAFITNESSQWMTSNREDGVFYKCNSLEYVDMSNITLSSKIENQRYGLQRLFVSLPSLKEVKMENIDLSLTEDLSEMFNGCTKLETLTFTPKSKLENCVNMDKFIASCINLKTLNISGLDNSNAYKHELGFEDLESLETLIADNSVVYIIKNNSNADKVEDVSWDTDIDFIEDADWKYVPNPKDPAFAGTELTIDASEFVQLVMKDGTSDATLG